MKYIVSVNKRWNSYFIMVENENEGRRYVVYSLKYTKEEGYTNYLNFNKKGASIPQKRLEELYEDWLADPMSWKIDENEECTPMEASWYKLYDRDDLVEYSNNRYKKSSYYSRIN